MAAKDYKAFIIEGEAREPLIINNISKVFFAHAKFKIITLPAGQNIYMLWKKLKEDNFETDIIEVLRENNKDLEEQLDGIGRDDFSEVYLFFDYDGHQDYIQYTESINPGEIRKMEACEIQKNRVFVLSAFPEFLLDYFGIKLWKKCVRHMNNQLEKRGCRNKG